MNLKERRKRARRKENRMILIAVSCILVFAIAVILLVLRDKEPEKTTDSSDENNNVQIENVEDHIDFFEIETKYCLLYYPKTWQERIEVQYSEEAGYKVEFYGEVEGKEKQHLFNVCFNSDDGDLLGYLQTDNEAINISVERFDMIFENDWTQEEQDQIYSMQEEMNFVIDMLDKVDNYVNP